MSGWIYCLRPIPRCPGYFADVTGGIWSQRRYKREPVKRRQQVNRYGYEQLLLQVCGKQKTFTVHRLVLAAFCGWQDGMQCRHLNGIRTCNDARNLEWGTLQENIDDKQVHGTQTKGEGHPSAKLTESEVRSIRSSSKSLGNLARQYRVNKKTIANIRDRKIWRHVQ